VSGADIKGEGGYTPPSDP